MEFEWDSNKEQINIRKHDVSFLEAMTIFDDPLEVAVSDPDHSIDEFRFVSIARSNLDHLLVVSYTDWLCLILSVGAGFVLSVPAAHHLRKGGFMSQADEEDTMREEYDFSGGVRGKHYEAYRKGTNLILLDPDLAKIFKDSAAVNAALKKLTELAPEYVLQICFCLDRDGWRAF